MRKIFLLMILCFLCACSNKKVNLSNLVERNNLMYEVNSDVPYSGGVELKLPNNLILMEGNYRKGKKSGEWITYSQNGQKLKIENYDNDGNYNGLLEEYNKKGQILRRENYKNGKLHGDFEYYFENGNKKKIGKYNNQKLHGTINEWYKNNNQKSIINYSNGLLDGTEEIYSKNGIIKRKASYSNNKLNGKLYEYFENGNPKKETEYKNGLVSGKYLSYYKNGNKELEYSKNDGKYKGLFTEFNSDGSIHRQYNYLPSKRINSGTWKKYWIGDNATKTVKQEYSTVSFDKQGKPNTPAKFYYTKGKLKAEINFSSIEPDILHGKFTTYYKDKNYVNNSRIRETGEYVNGKLNKNYKWFIGSTSQYTPPGLHAKITKNNTIYKVEANFKKGLIDGRVKLWVKFYDWGTRSDYALPFYVAHDYSNGKPIYLSNGFGINYSTKSFKDRYFDKDNKPVSWEQASNMKRNCVRFGTKM